MGLSPPTPPGRRRHAHGRLLARAGCALVLLILLRPAASAGESDEDRRAQYGIRLFRSLLAADLDLENKRDDDGKLLLVLFDGGKEARAKELAKTLAGGDGDPQPLRGMAVKIELTN